MYSATACKIKEISVTLIDIHHESREPATDNAPLTLPDGSTSRATSQSLSSVRTRLLSWPANARSKNTT